MDVLAAGGGGGGSREREEQPEPAGRTGRTASLVSGLLTELYSCADEDEAAGAGPGPGGPPRRRDSPDSSTEASGSDAFPGGRPAAGPSQRLQRQHLRQRGEGGGAGSLTRAGRARVPGLARFGPAPLTGSRASLSASVSAKAGFPFPLPGVCGVPSDRRSGF